MSVQGGLAGSIGTNINWATEGWVIFPRIFAVAISFWVIDVLSLGLAGIRKYQIYAQLSVTYREVNAEPLCGDFEFRSCVSMSLDSQKSE
jgi:hypothetical protein